MEFDLELGKAIDKIVAEKAKTVCVQLPDGLKPQALEIQRELKRETGAEIVIWGGSCFGACDVPFEARRLGVDLIIQWGHSSWV